ncbi:MAG: hypothetical protein J7J91_11100 [Deltaproteobacteria bacterium]|nr:hypothetical protein [Deltaproteobacteria bacterium]
MAVNDIGYSATDVAMVLSIDRVSAGQCVDRGKKILLCRETSLSDIMGRYLSDDAD